MGTWDGQLHPKQSIPPWTVFYTGLKDFLELGTFPWDKTSTQPSFPALDISLF